MRIALLGFIVAVGCGSKKQEEPPKAAPPDKPAEVKPAEVKPAEAKPPEAARPAPPPAADLGSCKVDATGTQAASATAPGGLMAVTAAAWFTDAERNDGMHIKQGLIINCNGADVHVSITNTADVPFGARSFDLGDKASPVRVLGAVSGKSLLGKRTGKLDITAFDAHHIAGTLDLTTSLDLAGKQPETIKATFDFVCPTCR